MSCDATRPTSPMSLDSTLPDSQAIHWLPQTIGHYKILRLLGQGGMGAVYEAEQENPHRRVALKVIKPGLTTTELLRRFEREAEALGRLHHAGIAQIYEAGTADTGQGPQPYYAMELLDGRPLLRYATEEQINTRQRLELLAKVSDAVHHAHQRGIIHRDLKPGNILVDETGQPKVLDFGVARLTDTDSQATRQTDLGQLVGTLAYMSPEQVTADPFDLDVRSDVYALGVILYELLAGRRPYDVNRKLLHEAVQVILEEEPTPLSAVHRTFRGDIETIVSKALEKDKARRYASASDLASDIRRYLHDEPIVARPASTLYQVGKFARRHRALVTGALVVVIALAIGAVASTWQAVRATHAEQAALRERDRARAAEGQARAERDRATNAEQATAKERDRAVEAEQIARQERDQTARQTQRANREAAIAQATNGFLQNDLLAQASSERQGDKPDPDIKVRTLLDRAGANLEGKFAKQPEVEAALQATLGDTYLSIGLYTEARRHLDASLALRRATAGELSVEALEAAEKAGTAALKQGKFAESEAMLVRTLEQSRKALGANHPVTLQTMSTLAGLYQFNRQFTKAEPLYRDALARLQHKLGPEHPETLQVMNDLALLQRTAGKYQEAESLLQQVIAAREKIFGPNHVKTLESVGVLGALYWQTNQYDKAEPLFVRTVEGRKKVLGTEHPDTLIAMGNLGALYWKVGRLPEAERIWVATADTMKRTLGPEHYNTVVQMINVAALYLAQRRWQEAETIFTSVLQSLRKSVGAEHPRTLSAMKNLATVYIGSERYKEAEEILLEVTKTRLRALGPKHPDTASSLTALGKVRMLQGRYSEAEQSLREALTIWIASMPNDYQRYITESYLGASLSRQSRFPEAEPLLLSGHEGLQQRTASLPVTERDELQHSIRRLIEHYESWNRPQSSQLWRARLPK